MYADKPFFNTQHAPMGAHASLTLGFPGPNGGLDLELCRAPEQSILIALESAEASGLFQALPFTHVPDDQERERFAKEEMSQRKGRVQVFEPDQIKRRFNIATDEWQAGDLTYTLYSPLHHLPDLEATPDDPAAQLALAPAVVAQVVADNRHGTRPRRVIVGMSRQSQTRGFYHLNADGAAKNLMGVADGRHLAMATDAQDAWAAIGFDPMSMLGDTKAFNRQALLGGWACIFAQVPAGEQRSLRFSYCFYRGDEATSGMETRYYYKRWFNSLESVASFALRNFDTTVAQALRDDAALDATRLSATQRFTVAHATRSYIYSTQMLERDGKPLWVVNEGEYNMINTLDLAADHSLYEAHRHPWTIRNVLEQYLERYSYEDQLRFEGSDQLHPGGLTFTHDMGVNGIFAPPGRSAYELAGLTGCFSHMSVEELLNWILCAGLYVEHSKDWDWARRRLEVLQRCQLSLEARDHYDLSQRCGVPRGDSSRCEDGREITTYDCLDPSLGRASGNTYIGGKAWAANLILARIFTALGRPELAARSQHNAKLAADTITASVQPDGRIPALLDGDTGAVILPVVESLVYPWFAGCREALRLDGSYAAYFAALTRHVREHVLTPQGCLFDDGGWRITSHNSNTFPAKAYVCQFAIRQVLGLQLDEINARADRAHVLWQLHPEHSRNCWTEQIDNGIAHAAKYYPRGVSSNIWRYE